jgi:pyruvate dehydrogenase E2 component (dihydrolipoamide acetyltransferase)
MSTATGIPVTVPDIGDFDAVPIIEILVAVGDTVAAEDPLVTLESDKATMDVPAPQAGTVIELLVTVGDSVSQGSPLMTLAPADGDGAATQDASAEARQENDSAETEQTPASGPASASGGPSDEPPMRASGNGTDPIYASPSVRRLARELGVSLSGIAGSGRKNRITKGDVEGLTRGGGASAPTGTGGAIPGLTLSPWPTVDYEKFGPVERVPRSRIQKIAAPTLARNWVMIPHVTHNDDADITELEAWRRQLNAEQGKDGVKLTMVSFLIAACVTTLKAFPDFNASLDGDELVRRRYYNIGFAADTPGGLVVPVIKQADQKGLLAIAAELSELSATARAGKLGPGDMSGGTFTISSLGGIGGTSFSPIINAPEVAILGVTRSALKPVWDAGAGEFRPRLMVPLSLSYDHRVIDGAAAARFVVHLAGVIGDLRRALL